MNGKTGIIAENANKAFDALCAAMERSRLPYYSKHEKIRLVRFCVDDEGPTMRFMIRIDANNERIAASCRLPVDTPEERRVEMAVAVCMATTAQSVGYFKYNLEDGMIYFRQNAPLRDCKYSEAFFAYLVECMTETVSEYAERFRRLADGRLSLTDFLKDP